MLLSGDTRTTLLDPAGTTLSYLSYSPTGHILYQRGWPVSEGIWALPFDASTLTVTDDPFPVAVSGGHPRVSSNGTLVYRSKPDDGLQQLIWLNRDGQIIESIGEPQQTLRNPIISPDGFRVAFNATNQMDIYVYDITRATMLLVRSDPSPDEDPIWSSDGKQLAFVSTPVGWGDIYLQASDGSGNATLLIGDPNVIVPTDWSGDGQYLMYNKVVNGQLDLWYVETKQGDGDGRIEGSVKFLQTEQSESSGVFSPDGRYVAYHSDVSGQMEVYIRPFPPLNEGQYKISSNGGIWPRWSPNGKELFYVEGNRLMVASVESEKGFRHDKSRLLFTAPEGVALQSPPATLETDRLYDVGDDGQRFLAVQTTVEEEQTAIIVVQNWYAEFKDR